MIRVLFVCAGNTCRSPMAEALLRSHVASAGLAAQIAVGSAGVSAVQGDPVNPRSVQELVAHGIRYAGQARRFSPEDWAHSDLIVTMDRSNLAAVERIHPAGNEGVTARLLMSFAPAAGVDDVFDPYGTDRYGEAFALIEQGVEGLLAYLRKEYHL